MFYGMDRQGAGGLVILAIIGILLLGLLIVVIFWDVPWQLLGFIAAFALIKFITYKPKGRNNEFKR